MVKPQDELLRKSRKMIIFVATPGANAARLPRPMTNRSNLIRSILFIALLPALLPALGGNVVVTADGPYRPVSVTPAAQSGLTALYVAHSSNGLTAVYEPDDAGAQVTWLRYADLGGGYAEPIEGAAGTTLAGLKPGYGYIAVENGRQTAFYVADWGAAPYDVTAVEVTGRDCSGTVLSPVGSAPRMSYTGINGRAFEIDRAIEVRFTTMEWNATAGQMTTVQQTQTVAAVEGDISMPASYCATAYTVTGDRFAAEWGFAQSVGTATVDPVAVTAHTSAVRLNPDKPDNQMADDGADASGLGGSAPATLTFSAHATDAAVYEEWQTAADPEFNIIGLRFNEPEFTHTFDQAGTVYVRYLCANADGSCQYESETYAVSLSTSALECPNAFSPGASEGTNDEWRVSYRSIVRFECHIFDRHGHELAVLRDPSQGWDGKRGGKLVPAGVYYYVIDAEGADGRKYKLGGDINIVRYR